MLDDLIRKHDKIGSTAEFVVVAREHTKMLRSLKKAIKTG